MTELTAKDACDALVDQAEIARADGDLDTCFARYVEALQCAPGRYRHVKHATLRARARWLVKNPPGTREYGNPDRDLYAYIR